MEKEITYEDFAKAISEMQLTNIKGKEYGEVSEKLKALRKIFPLATVETIQTRLEGEIGSREVEYKAFVYVYVNGEKRLLGDGDAYEKENSTFINKTSFIENCQTSALGRALSASGIIGGNSVASYEEVANAMMNQTPKKTDDGKITDAIWKDLNKAYNKEQIKEMYKELGITNGKDMPLEYAKKKIDEFLYNKDSMPDKEFF